MKNASPKSVLAQKFAMNLLKNIKEKVQPNDHEDLLVEASEALQIPYIELVGKHSDNVMEIVYSALMMKAISLRSNTRAEKVKKARDIEQ